jgi:DNA-directed RNA polymerase subunit N (RpoN/RPB10)
MTHPKECFQCGAPTGFIIDEDTPDDGWFHCHRCGERIVKVSDVFKNSAEDIEERAKRNLGFYEFKPKRGT